jgi:hypothetical protein
MNVDHVDPEVALERTVRLICDHNGTIERLKALEAELAALEADERHQFERYAAGYVNELPLCRDADRERLATLIAEARPLARAAEAAIEPLMAVQRQTRQRLEAQKTVAVKSVAEQLLDADENDREMVNDLAGHIVELLARRQGLRSFLSEQGRSLVSKGDVVNGTAILRMVETAGSVQTPRLEVDRSRVLQAIAEIAARFQKLKGGGG